MQTINAEMKIPSSRNKGNTVVLVLEPKIGLLGQYQASRPNDASGKNFGVCHWENDRPGVPPPGFQGNKRFVLKPWYSNCWWIPLCHAWSIVCHGWLQSMSGGGPRTRRSNFRQFTSNLRPSFVYKFCGAQLQNKPPMNKNALFRSEHIPDPDERLWSQKIEGKVFQSQFRLGNLGHPSRRRSGRCCNVSFPSGHGKLIFLKMRRNNPSPNRWH